MPCEHVKNVLTALNAVDLIKPSRKQCLERTRAPPLNQYLPAALTLAFVYLALNVALRLCIAWPLIFSDDIAALEICGIFLLGLMNDVVAWLGMALPAGILLLSWPGMRFAKRASLAALLTLEFSVLLIALLSDLATWVEIDMRLGRVLAQHGTYIEETLRFALEYARGVAWYFWPLPATVIAATAWPALRTAPILARLSTEHSVRRTLLGFVAASTAVLIVYPASNDITLSEKRSVNDAAENS